MGDEASNGAAITWLGSGQRVRNLWHALTSAAVCHCAYGSVITSDYSAPLQTESDTDASLMATETAFPCHVSEIRIDVLQELNEPGNNALKWN